MEADRELGAGGDSRGGGPRLARPHPLGAAAARRPDLKRARGLRVGARRIERGRPGTRVSVASLTTPTGDRLFAYGTLMTGFVRRPLLGPAAVLEGRGRIQGALYDFRDYPGVVLDDAGWVVGELYRIDDLAARLPALDREEGYDPANEERSLYVRRRVPVLLEDGASREAWVYTLNDRWGPPGRAPRIPSGDWRAQVAARG